MPKKKYPNYKDHPIYKLLAEQARKERCDMWIEAEDEVRKICNELGRSDISDI